VRTWGIAAPEHREAAAAGRLAAGGGGGAAPGEGIAARLQGSRRVPDRWRRPAQGYEIRPQDRESHHREQGFAFEQRG
jgi:hypothetical protein